MRSCGSSIVLLSMRLCSRQWESGELQGDVWSPWALCRNEDDRAASKWHQHTFPLTRETLQKQMKKVLFSCNEKKIFSHSVLFEATKGLKVASESRTVPSKCVQLNVYY